MTDQLRDLLTPTWPRAELEQRYQDLWAAHVRVVAALGRVRETLSVIASDRTNPDVVNWALQGLRDAGERY